MSLKRQVAENSGKNPKKSRTKGPTTQAQPLPDESVEVSNPIVADEIFNKVITLQMKAISLREQNWWTIIDLVTKTKGAVLQVTEQDRLLYQIDGRLKEYAAKFEASKQRAIDRIEEIENIGKSAEVLRMKFETLRRSS